MSVSLALDVMQLISVVVEIKPQRPLGAQQPGRVAGIPMLSGQPGSSCAGGAQAVV